ncbi:hypothetical protein BDV98DRAFT_597711 [Pterulicium gracile]|uniref:Uncharacterized protein n=1 Tax=Pterulicium gracile TaxID=1884261 RepID=A0A5C3Q2K8_9AGAR|nr:hypothetical protein BDV98DRAFT_597711 [Pterula gracilis]
MSPQFNAQRRSVYRTWLSSHERFIGRYDVPGQQQMPLAIIAYQLLEKRFQILNLWRPITNAALEWPLALCDYKTVDEKQDALVTTLIYPQGDPVELFSIKYNPNQKWKYLRDMGLDEGVFIKCVQDGSVAVFAAHTAFEDPSSPVGVPHRESIEARTLVFYD